MVASKHTSLAAQRGLSLSGLLVILITLGLLALLAMKIFPTFLEYRSSKVGIQAAKKVGGTPREMRDAFDKTANINDISGLSGKDLIFTKESGETEVAFSYDKQIPLIDNVMLVIHYQATTDPSGRIPEKPAEPTP